MRVCQRHRKMWRPLITAMCVLLSVLLLHSCSPQTPPLPSESADPTAVTEPSVTNTILPDDAVFTRGLPGDRKDRLMVGVNDPDRLNLNPFVSGTRLFPVDPSGFYQPIYQTLFIFEPTRLMYRSVLADDFELSAQNLIINLQKDVLWHDGYALTAQDVLFTLETHRKFDTETGKVLARCVSEMRAEGEDSLEILLREDEKNASWHVLEALSHMPVVARHIWEVAVADVSDAESLTDRAVRVVGTGPWKYYQEDAASISFFRHAAEGDAKPSYMTVLKYGQVSFAFYAIENSEIDLLIDENGFGAGQDGKEIQESEEPRDSDLHCVYAGQSLGGLAINYGSRPELGRRAFRHLLVAIANPEETGKWWSAYPVDIARRDVLAIPSVMERLDRTALESVLGEVSEQVLETLIDEAGMTRQPGEKICLDGEPLDPLTLIYPEQSDHIASACFQYAKMAEEQGLTIHLQPVAVSKWRNQLASGDYELAYMESSVNETFIETVERIAMIPSRQDGAFVAGKEFDVARARDTLEMLPEGHTHSEIVACYQVLAEWMLREWLFVPLGAGYREVALQNRSVQAEVPLDTIIVFPVLTRKRPPSK